MSRRSALSYEFVDYVPNTVGDGLIYITTRYATAVHLCCCGCGSEIVTPISPADWQVTFDGQSVSLHPSIGNWSLPCRSHYWIRRSRVIWAPSWTEQEITEGRELDSSATEGRFVKDSMEQRLVVAGAEQPNGTSHGRGTLLQRIRRLLE